MLCLCNLHPDLDLLLNPLSSLRKPTEILPGFLSQLQPHGDQSSNEDLHPASQHQRSMKMPSDYSLWALFVGDNVSWSVP